MKSKRDLKKVAREFRMYGSRLLSTKYGNGMGDLKRFLNFIETNKVIYKFILENNNEKYDMEEICKNRGWREKYPLPIEKDKEVAFIYQLLKHGQANFGDYTAFTHGYGSGNKLQDHMDAFNNEVTKHLVDYIREYLEDAILDIEEAEEEEIASRKVFISYSWANKDITDMIDEDFKGLGIDLTRDERDLRYKDSIKQFMQQVGKHDHVIMIISDSYLKSENCMYEVMEVMRNREYKKKILMIILKEEDKRYYKDYGDRMKNDQKFYDLAIGADIYSAAGRISYIEYWERKEEELETSISRLKNDINKIQPLNELKRLNNITRDIGDFLNELSDWMSIPLKELKESNYKPLLDDMNVSEREMV